MESLAGLKMKACVRKLQRTRFARRGGSLVLKRIEVRHNVIIQG